MVSKLLAPSEIWLNYDPEIDFLDAKSIDKCGNLEIFTFDAAVNNEKTTIMAKVFRTKANNKKTILIVGSFYKATDESVVDSLLSSGYNIVEIDYTAIFKDTQTKYPDKYSYGNIKNANEHLKSIKESAYDTSLYLYCKVIRRAISFVKEAIINARIVLMGFLEGVDIAIQVAGLDRRVMGLVCINGASYTEYLSYNLYDLTQKLEMDEERTAYMVGVSSTAYIKLIKCPVVIGIGSNSCKSDIDRLSNFLSLLDDKVERVFTISPRTRDYIDNFSFTVIKNSIKDIFSKKFLAINPGMKLEENKEKKVYVYVTNKITDKEIESVAIYYAINELNRRYRNYKYKRCELASINEYIANIDTAKGVRSLFVFAEILYTDGMRLTSLCDYIEIENGEETTETLKRLVFTNTEKDHTFVAGTNLPVLLGKGIKRQVNSLQLMEITSSTNDLLTYEIGEDNYAKKCSTMQIDINSSTHNKVEILLGVDSKNEIKEYSFKLNVEGTKEMFEDYILEAKDFKDIEFLSLKDFRDVKYIRVKGEKPFAIGNIILI